MKNRFADYDEMGLRTLLLREDGVWPESESSLPTQNELGADFYLFYFSFEYINSFSYFLFKRRGSTKSSIYSVVCAGA